MMKTAVLIYVALFSTAVLAVDFENFQQYMLDMHNSIRSEAGGSRMKAVCTNDQVCSVDCL